MKKELVDIVSRYSDEFGIAVEFTDTSAKFVTDDGEIVLEEKDGAANLKRVEPLDETDDDQIMRLSKIRRHFTGYLRAALEEASKKGADPAPEPPKKKAGRPPKSEKQSCRQMKRKLRSPGGLPGAPKLPKMRRGQKRQLMIRQMPPLNHRLHQQPRKRRNCRIFARSAMELARFSRRSTS